MAEIAIRAVGLGKQYKIGKSEALLQTQTLRDKITESVRTGITRVLTMQDDGPRVVNTDFWAVRDVSFEVRRGEVVGLIGRNGSGKSTILKMLARITVPTEGSAEIHGRVGSLLEVGTGFHTELSGRENIYMSGALLGMKRQEIDRKFDEIVSFSEVEQFIDTPVKRYSTGMYLRLAFSVAAHLEPEILLVDEVLAVGDAAFQRKCIAKMTDIAKEGRTVIFVSHNVPVVENLCSHALLLNQGALIDQGEPHEIIDKYLKMTVDLGEKTWMAGQKQREGSGEIRLRSFHLEDHNGKVIKLARSGQNVNLCFEYDCPQWKPAPRGVDVTVTALTLDGQRMFGLAASYVNSAFDTIPHSGTFRCNLASFPLNVGSYQLEVRVSTGNGMADIIPACPLNVEQGDFYGSGVTPPQTNGPFLVQSRWDVAARAPRTPAPQPANGDLQKR